MDVRIDLDDLDLTFKATRVLKLPAIAISD